MADSGSDVSVKFGADVDGAIAGINKMTELMEGFSGSVEGLTGPLGELAEAALAAFGVEKLDQFIERIGDLGLQVERTSEQLGIGVQQVSLLNYAAETNDVSTSQMRNSLERLTVGLQAAMEGTNRQADAFKTLAGESAQQFIKSGGDMNDLIMRIAKNTDAMNGKVNLAPSFIALMGRSGADAIPVFRELGSNIEETKEKLASAGLAFSPELIERISETRKANIDLKEANEGLGVSLFSVLKPAIDGAVLGFRMFVQTIQDSLNNGGVLQGVLEGITGALLGIESAFIVIGHVSTVVITALLDLIDAALIKIQSWGMAIWDAAHGNITKAKLEIQAGTDEITAMFAHASEKEIQEDAQTTQKLKAIWSDYFNYIKNDAHSSQDQTSGGGSGAPLSGDNTAASLKLMNEDIQNHKAMLEEEIADVGQNIKAKMILEQQYYDWLAAKYPQDQKALSEAGRMIAQTQNQEIQQMDQKWNGFFNSFNRGINGMLTGTGSFKKAMADMMLSLVDTFLKYVEQMVAHWIDSEILKTSATNAGNAARTASNTAAAATGSAVAAASSAKTVMADAAKAYSGTYAFLSPAMGPLAAVPAAGAFAAVAAFEGLASFDVGTPFVPNTGIAMVHKGEAIIPANMNKGSFGGGPEVHYHVSAIDAQGVQEFFNTHGSIMAAQLVDSYQRGNPAFRYPR